MQNRPRAGDFIPDMTRHDKTAAGLLAVAVHLLNRFALLFGRMLGEQLDFDREKVQRNGDREMVYYGLRFTAQGGRFRPD